MKKQSIKTNDAPEALGPYSQGIRVENMVTKKTIEIITI